MTEPRWRPRAAAIDRRDEAQRRLSSITAGVLAGGIALTATAAGLAWLTDPGRSASAATTDPTSPSSDGTPQFGGDGLQAPGQAPGYGGFGYRSHAVSGGS
jgi:hypothetical protein